MSQDSVHIYEVSPRDGLQNEPGVVSTDNKLALIDALAHTGVTDIEVTSFVRPSWIPQLADAAQLVPRLRPVDGVNYWALIPNMRGLERALDVGISHVATFMSASETHNKKNLNRTRRESISSLREVIGTAKDEGLFVRAYLSTVYGCPYEGAVDVQRTAELAAELHTAGADVLALGDTTGMGDPALVVRVAEAMQAAGIPLDAIAMHMHDTCGTALANILAGYQAGVRTFDGSVAGVGGCPYAPGASGNAATEDIVHMFQAMGVDTGVDLERLAETGARLGEILGRDLPGRYHKYHLGSRARQQARSQTA